MTTMAATMRRPYWRLEMTQDGDKRISFLSLSLEYECYCKARSYYDPHIGVAEHCPFNLSLLHLHTCDSPKETT